MQLQRQLQLRVANSLQRPERGERLQEVKALFAPFEDDSLGNHSTEKLSTIQHPKKEVTIRRNGIMVITLASHPSGRPWFSGVLPFGR